MNKVFVIILIFSGFFLQAQSVSKLIDKAREEQYEQNYDQSLNTIKSALEKDPNNLAALGLKSI